MNARVEQMAEWLVRHKIEEFNNIDVALALNVPSHQASQIIQEYLRAQAEPGRAVERVIRRIGRTSGTIWRVGEAAGDVRGISKQLADDVQCRIENVILQVIDAIVERNPRARAQATHTTLEIGRLVEQLARL